MSKKMTAILLAIAVLVLAGCGRKAEPTQPETIPAMTEVASAETTEEEVVIYGIEDSIFDDMPEETAASADSGKQQAGSSAGSSNGSNDGLKEPDGPDAAPGKDDKPTQSETDKTESEEEETEPTEETIPQELSDYEKFHALSPAEQQEFVESFASIDAFFEWYNAAQEEYERNNPSIDVGSGPIDLSKLPE